MQLLDEARKRIGHIVEAAEDIQTWTQAWTFDDYMQAGVVRSAVERQFITIGETLRAAIRAQAEIGGALTDVADIVAFRHVLVHGYAYVYDDFVWAVITDDLPRLLAEVRPLLGPPHA
jgi:uncharacterized protein with HEPN domain